MQATLTPPQSHRAPMDKSVAVDHAAAHAHQEASVNSDALLRGHKSVCIVHNGATYRLQATKLGKLILTK